MVIFPPTLHWSVESLVRTGLLLMTSIFDA
jgi:hypothetical protein